jgi:carboxyl-terminal processing protease
MLKKIIVLIFSVVLLAVAFGAGFQFGKLQIPVTPPEGVLNPETGKPQGIDFSLFWEAWRALEEKFVDSGKINYQDMLYGAIEGMVNSLKDPYTVFMPPQESKIFKEDVTGEFQGVGMEIGIRDNGLTVIAPLEGTPAQRAGLRAGDKITKIDDTDTVGMTTDDAVKLIRGPKGTEVTLTIFREGWSQAKEFTIVREVITVPSLKWEMKDDNIAYLKLYQFSQQAGIDFNNAAAQILASSAQKIILDLRDNPGGYLEVAQDIAGWFLERGQVVTIEDFGGKKENETYLAKGNSKLLSYPLVILINRGSASGSEILAGALRDNRGIKLIGQTSFGKGSVQELTELSEGSLKVTVAKWLTPQGEVIGGVGLTPDIEIELSEEDFNEGRDPQLDKAIEVIKTL